MSFEGLAVGCLRRKGPSSGLGWRLFGAFRLRYLRSQAAQVFGPCFALESGGLMAFIGNVFRWKRREPRGAPSFSICAFHDCFDFDLLYFASPCAPWPHAKPLYCGFLASAASSADICHTAPDRGAFFFRFADIAPTSSHSLFSRPIVAGDKARSATLRMLVLQAA